MGRLRTLVTLKADMAWPVLPVQCVGSSTRLRKGGAKWSTKKYERRGGGGGGGLYVWGAEREHSSPISKAKG